MKVLAVVALCISLLVALGTAARMADDDYCIRDTRGVPEGSSVSGKPSLVPLGLHCEWRTPSGSRIQQPPNLGLSYSILALIASSLTLIIVKSRESNGST